MTVGVFHIDKDRPTDLSKGILGGFDWSNDDVVRKTLEDKFDILDIRGASTAGVPGLSDRFYVIHERATKDAILWKD